MSNLKENNRSLNIFYNVYRHKTLFMYDTFIKYCYISNTNKNINNHRMIRDDVLIFQSLKPVKG